MTELDVDVPDGPGQDDARHLIEVGRRAAMSRGASAQDSEDVAQEAYARLLVAEHRLDPSARLPFVVTTARNLAVDRHRAVDRDRRHRHRLHEADRSAAPDEQLVDSERDSAVGRALLVQPEPERRLLVGHAEGASTTELAEREGSTPGAIAARLARSRARMRLDYVLALRGVTLPGPACRPVLMAVSAGDRRRQRALDAAGHLETCPTCAELVPPLAERRSGLAGLATAPLLLLGGLGGSLARFLRTTTGAAVTSATVVAVAAGAVAAVLVGQPGPRHAPQAARTAAGAPSATATAQVPVPVTAATVPGLRTDDGGPVTAAGLDALVGRRLVAVSAPVQSVVAHPGFWLGTGARRVYVHIEHADRVRTPVRPGSSVDLTGRLVPNTPGLAAADGVVDAEGRAQLGRQGVHLSVDAADLRVR